MSQPFRRRRRRLIDRSRPLSFTFDGVAYRGYEGDTLASALLANGVHLVGRSFKYHRPRGISRRRRGGAERARRRRARAGPLHAQSARDADPALRRPRRHEPEPLAVARLRRRRHQRLPLAAVRRRLLLQDLHGAELFGKNWAWKHVYEPLIRRAAGLGAAPREPDPDRYRALSTIATC